MFTKTIRLYGQYANILKKYVKANKDDDLVSFQLTNNDDGKPQKAYIFETMYQCLITAAILGMIHDKREPESSDKETYATIFNEVLVKNNTTLKIIYEQMVLTDKHLDLSNDERIRKAFTPITGEENERKEEEYFLTFVRGGLLVLDEMFNKCQTYEDLANELTRIQLKYSTTEE